MVPETSSCGDAGGTGSSTAPGGSSDARSTTGGVGGRQGFHRGGQDLVELPGLALDGRHHRGVGSETPSLASGVSGRRRCADRSGFVGHAGQRAAWVPADRRAMRGAGAGPAEAPSSGGPDPGMAGSAPDAWAARPAAGSARSCAVGEYGIGAIRDRSSGVRTHPGGRATATGARRVPHAVERRCASRWASAAFQPACQPSGSGPGRPGRFPERFPASSAAIARPPAPPVRTADVPSRQARARSARSLTSGVETTGVRPAAMWTPVSQSGSAATSCWRVKQ